jgi:hypothetical protein
VPALPNVIIIGAAKCGTTSLHMYLDAHPEIAMARVKETEFFISDGTQAHGLDWYAAHFDASLPVRGESSTNYTNLPRSGGAATRMREVVPDARLIYLVRDPFHRMESHYVHQRASGTEHKTFDQALREPTNPYLSISKYATQLAPFLAQYPDRQILVESQERLLSRRGEVLTRIFRFLDVDPFFHATDFGREWNQSEGKGRVYTGAVRLSRRTQARGIRLPSRLRWPVERLLRNARVGGRTHERPKISQDLQRALYHELKHEADTLRAITGLELSEWSV